MKPSVLAVTYRSRAVFGVGFVVLGGVALYRVVLAAGAPASSKLIGAGLGAVMIALGVFRIAQYARWRRENRTGDRAS